MTFRGLLLSFVSSQIKYLILKKALDSSNLSILKKEKSTHCAVLMTKKGTFLAQDFNDPEHHAEVNVINKVKKKYTARFLKTICLREGGFVMYIVRFSKDKKGYSLSKPCQNCSKKIDNCKGIVEVYHS